MVDVIPTSLQKTYAHYVPRVSSKGDEIHQQTVHKQIILSKRNWQKMLNSYKMLKFSDEQQKSCFLPTQF